ncbi:MAG: hypothetical protein OHK0039_01800 [Bacteroidia bacterium]
MDELLKKFLYTGVGLVSLTAEKLQEAVDDLVGKGKLSEKEGKKILDDFFNTTEAKRADFESKMREAAESVMDRLNFTPKSEYDALLQRVQELEAKLAAATQAGGDEEGGAKKKTTRKRSEQDDETSA